MDSSLVRPRVLILTASVGAGHDGVAHGLATELEQLGYDARVENSLRRATRWAEWVVLSGYAAQLRFAPWSYDLLYRATNRFRSLSRFSKWFAALIGARRMGQLISAHNPVLVVTTYHLTSAMLAKLRRQGRLPMPAVAMMTDLAPHRMWVHPDLDAHLVLHPRTVDIVASMTPGPVVAVRAPLRGEFYEPQARSEARQWLCVDDSARVAVVTGGSWGVGDLEETVAACSKAGWTAAVVCGRNERLRTELHIASTPGTIVLGFVEDMKTLMDAADAVIVNGAGLTCLEAFRRRVPVVFHDPIPGHGIDNARYMREVGIARFGETHEELIAELDRVRLGASLIEAERAFRLFEAPSSGEVLHEIVSGPPGSPLAKARARASEKQQARRSSRALP